MSLIYHKCGNRMEYSYSIHEYLGKPSTISVSLMPEGIVIFEATEHGSDSYTVKGTESGRRKIYSKALVTEILKHYHIPEPLDGKSAVPFANWEKGTFEDTESPYALIPIDTMNMEVQNNGSEQYVFK